MQQLFSEKTIKAIFLFLLVFVLLTPLVVFPQLSRSVLVSKWIFLSLVTELAFFFCLSIFLWKSILSRLKHPLFVLYAASIFWIVLSSLSGIDPLNSFWGNAVRPGGWFLLLHVCLFFAFLLCLEKSIIIKSVDWFIGVGALVSLYAIFERMGLLPVLGGTFNGRSTSTIGNPIYLAGFLILPLTLAIFQVCQKKRVWWNGISAGLIVTGILTAWTRGAFLGIAVSLLIGGIFYVWNRFGWKIGGSVLACIVFASALLFSQISFQDRNILDRLSYWDMAKQSFYEHSFKGIGYENFYRAAEKFYTPSMYAGEGTFIDKPHNQLLELLVTSGVVGVGLYLAVCSYVIYCLSKLFISHRLSRKEFSVLLGGFLAFQIQNLFAFDTITTLFTFVYFLAFLVWIEDGKAAQTLMSYRKPLFPWMGIVFTILCVGSMSLFVFLPIGQYFHKEFLLNKTNTPEQALAYTSSFSSLPFVYDSADVGKFYKIRAGDLLGLNPTDLSDVDRLLNVSMDFYRSAAELHPQRGEYWYQLASVSVMQAAAHKQPVSEAGKQWIQQSMILMPNRIEPKIAEAYVVVLDGNPDKAVRALESLDKNYFESPQFLWTLMLFYRQIGRADDAAFVGYQSIQKHVRIHTTSEIVWMADYYAGKQDFEKVVRLYELAVSTEPGNTSLLPNLIGAYVANGQMDKAVEIAHVIIEKDPEHALDAKVFIEGIQKR